MGSEPDDLSDELVSLCAMLMTETASEWQRGMAMPEHRWMKWQIIAWVILLLAVTLWELWRWWNG